MNSKAFAGIPWPIERNEKAEFPKENPLGSRGFGLQVSGKCHGGARWRNAAASVALAAGIFCFTSGSALLAPVAHAQNIGERSVSGTVLNADSVAVPNATVFLRNEKTKSIRSFSTDSLGHFRFAQVNMAEDFDLWAEKDAHKSPVKTVSSWDARKDFISDLKLK